jgi:hypothetical protein
LRLEARAYQLKTKLNKMEETNNTTQTATDVYTLIAAGGFKVLVACEESQTVCKAFRALGIEAYSCDIQEPSGGHPEWHIQGDAVKEAYSGKYDMMIAHPTLYLYE